LATNTTHEGRRMQHETTDDRYQHFEDFTPPPGHMSVLLENPDGRSLAAMVEIEQARGVLRNIEKAIVTMAEDEMTTQHVAAGRVLTDPEFRIDGRTPEDEAQLVCISTLVWLLTHPDRPMFEDTISELRDALDRGAVVIDLDHDRKTQEIAVSVHQVATLMTN